jgi:hypothetical protein
LEASLDYSSPTGSREAVARLPLLGVALPATILAVSEVKAQTAGMERREERREDRLERREERRDDRLDRREDRVERRDGVVDQPGTTGSTATTAPK